MYIYTDEKEKVIAITERDIIQNYHRKYKVQKDIQIPKTLHLYTFNGKDFVLDNSSFAFELKEKKQEIFRLEKNRLQQILDQYGYLSLADVQFYASKNDTEAKSILTFYSNANNNGYDDLIWNWIDNTLPTYKDVNQLLKLDLKAVEEQIYQQAIANNPLP